MQQGSWAAIGGLTIAAWYSVEHCICGRDKRWQMLTNPGERDGLSGFFYL